MFSEAIQCERESKGGGFAINPTIRNGIAREVDAENRRTIAVNDWRSTPDWSREEGATAQG